MNEIKLEIIMSCVEHEIYNARQKFPGSTDMIIALMEEVGELAEAFLQTKEKAKDTSVFREAIHVIATVIRLVQEGDDNFPDGKPQYKDYMEYRP